MAAKSHELDIIQPNKGLEIKFGAILTSYFWSYRKAILIFFLIYLLKLKKDIKAVKRAEKVKFDRKTPYEKQVEHYIKIISLILVMYNAKEVKEALTGAMKASLLNIQESLQDALREPIYDYLRKQAYMITAAFASAAIAAGISSDYVMTRLFSGTAPELPPEPGLPTKPPAIDPRDPLKQPDNFNVPKVPDPPVTPPPVPVPPGTPIPPGGMPPGGQPTPPPAVPPSVPTPPAVPPVPPVTPPVVPPPVPPSGQGPTPPTPPGQPPLPPGTPVPPGTTPPGPTPPAPPPSPPGVPVPPVLPGKGKGMWLSPEAERELQKICTLATIHAARLAYPLIRDIIPNVVDWVRNGYNPDLIMDAILNNPNIPASKAQGVLLQITLMVNNAVQRINMLSLGFREATWIHVPGEFTSRETHIKFDRRRFDLQVGLFDTDVSKNVFPGELWWCRCCMKGIIPPGLI